MDKKPWYDGGKSLGIGVNKPTMTPIPKRKKITIDGNGRVVVIEEKQDIKEWKGPTPPVW